MTKTASQKINKTDQQTLSSILRHGYSVQYGKRNYNRLVDTGLVERVILSPEHTKLTLDHGTTGYVLTEAGLEIAEAMWVEEG